MTEEIAASLEALQERCKTDAGRKTHQIALFVVAGTGASSGVPLAKQASSLGVW